MGKTVQKLLKIIIHFQNWPVRFLELAHLAPRRLVTLQLRNGPSFFVRPYSSDVSCLQSITRDGEYFRYFNVMPGDTVVDIGANIGSFAVFAAYNEPTSRVIAVEPVQKNFDILRKNIDCNRLANIVAVRGGISDVSGPLIFHHGKGAWFASGSLYRIEATSDSKEEVPGRTLADLFAEYGIERCDFLKMDCEGAEYKILLGCPDSVWLKIRKIALEFHNFEPGKNQFDLLDLLRSRGFRAIIPRKYERKEIGLIFGVRE
ncbi:hypothetical protein A3F28_01315 [Candidatus Uhrbacteria bacterium RIFCSPHIGHO2_12_FULL_57_11]|uniref:Methyltransferase FkbM domain-containing protein n=1 Tax=Candidatus Uhrbacteria bacterium RIFCSPHIGHO2_12_FULL_57_11 TaxID=1802398 RepID=A0A1F7UN33_9BACT|nr:MAG: hypothetical protein A3F28_01315 [Candidatus Uhrbacteria bacterium RIFCSPHIGHO2_12_FULL_57_11]